MSAPEGSDPPASPPTGPPPPGFPAPGYPPPGYPGAGYPRPALPLDLVGGAQAGRRAALAIWVGLVAAVTQTVCAAITFESTQESFEQLVELFDDIGAGRTPVQPEPTTVEPLVLIAGLASQIAGLVFLGAGIVFLIWFHKALSNARGLGLRLSHPPGWGVAGFLVPIINLWFPYQSMRDLFPDGHPARSRVGRWWACYLGASFAGAFSVAAYLVAPAAGYVVVVVVVGLYVAAAVLVRGLIAEAVSAHESLAGDGGWPGATGPVAAPDHPVALPGYAPPAAPPGAGPPGPPAPGPVAPAPPPKDPWGRS